MCRCDLTNFKTRGVLYSKGVGSDPIILRVKRRERVGGWQIHEICIGDLCSLEQRIQRRSRANGAGGVIDLVCL